MGLDIRTVYECNVWKKQLNELGFNVLIINDDGDFCCANGPYLFITNTDGVWMANIFDDEDLDDFLYDYTVEPDVVPQQLPLRVVPVDLNNSIAVKDKDKRD